MRRKTLMRLISHLDVVVVWLCGVKGHAAEEGQDAVAALHRPVAELHEGALVARHGVVGRTATQTWKIGRDREKLMTERDRVNDMYIER
jgi:hypothetical protein